MNTSAPSRPVFYVSDRTGITARTLGQTLLTQFSSIPFEPFTLPFITTEERARNAVLIINEAAHRSGMRPLVFNTLVIDELKDIIHSCDGKVFDLFDTFIASLEEELDLSSSHTVGLSHGIRNDEDYQARMDAVNYSLNSDDGSGAQHYDKADVILIGASRCGKTPSCLYLSMQYGLNAANYPITDQDLESDRLPEIIRPHRDKVIGLTISPQRLNRIREKRRPNSQYASLAQCKKELSVIEEMYQNEKINPMDVSQMSIEEIATTIIQKFYQS